MLPLGQRVEVSVPHTVVWVFLVCLQVTTPFFYFLVSVLPGVLCGASAVTLQASQRQQPGLGPGAHPAPW